MKKILILSALVLCAATMFSCGGNDPEPVKEDIMYFIENGATQYTIHYPEKGTEEERLAAVHLRTALNDLTGTRLTVIDDFLNTKTGETAAQYEILVGNTNRDESKAANAGLGADEIYIGVKNDKIIITAGSAELMEEAVGTFIDDCVKIVQAENSKNAGVIKNLDMKIKPVITVVTEQPFDERIKDASAITNGKYRLILPFGNDGYSVYVTDENSEPLYFSEKPVKIYWKKGSTKTDMSFCYASVAEKDGKLECKAEVKASKTVFEVTDIWYAAAGNGFAFDRTVSVKDAGDVIGFGSGFAVSDMNPTSERNDYEYFVPCVIYKDTEYMAHGGDIYGETKTLFADLMTADRNLAKETETGLPLAMARKKSTGYSVTLQHLNPVLSGGSGASFQASSTSNSEQYGSIGFNFKDGLSVEYCYPAQISPNNYVGINGDITVYHKPEEGYSDSYSLVLSVEKSDDFQSAMTESYTNAYMLELPEIKKHFDMDTVLAQNAELLDGLYHEWGTKGSKTAGFPFAVSVSDFDHYYNEGVYGMGYIGSNIYCALLLYQVGLEQNNAGYINEAKTILNFWSSDKIMGYEVPVVEWRPENNADGGSPANANSQLRKLVDGFEAMLESYQLGKLNGEDNKQWFDACVKFADTLVELQENDGSYFRRYSVVNRKLTDESSTTKLNTMFPVKFLVMMYKETGNKAYLDAAVRAADYSYENIYPMGKYAGGTDDGYLRIDREAGIYAANSWAAIFDATGDERYGKALEHALAYVMSYTYCYDYAVPSAGTTRESQINPVREGGIIGLSIIANVGTNIDTFNAMEYYEMFRQYLRTGDDVWLEMAKMLEHNTKLTTDYEGKLGYIYKAMCCEATNVYNFKYFTAEQGVWLPWITATLCKPITEMKIELGCADVEELARGNLNELTEKLGLAKIK